MVPSPGEPPDAWWENTGYAAGVQQQAAADGGRTGSADPFVAFYHDVPRPLASFSSSVRCPSRTSSWSSTSRTETTDQPYHEGWRRPLRAAYARFILMWFPHPAIEHQRPTRLREAS